jgi:predicted aspartyl protease
METAEMGRVLTKATVENLMDLWDVKRGMRSPDAVRRVELENALVDTGATSLCLPTRYVQELGLMKRFEKPVVTSLGPRMAGIYDAVRLTIQGRDCTVDVTEVPDSVPVLIGQIPLEWMDFVVDPRTQRLIGNPEHGGEQTIEML